MEDSRMRSRRRAARALAEKRRRGTAGASCDEESPTRERAKPPRRKKKDTVFEEDVIDGFAILSFRSYEDIEVFSGKTPSRVISDSGEKKNNKISLKNGKASNENIPNNGVVAVKEEIVIKKEPPEPVVLAEVKPVLLIEKQDPGTSDECERKEKEKVVVPDRVIKREADLDDRLSDASSRCSSGKGYICDSEDDDKASDSGSLLSSSPPPPSRKHESVPKEREESPPPPAAAAIAPTTVQPPQPPVAAVVNGHHPRPLTPREEKPTVVVQHRLPPSPQPQVHLPPPPVSHQPPPPTLQPSSHPQPTVHIGNGVAPKTERLSPPPPHSSPYGPPPSVAPAVVSSVLPPSYHQPSHHSPHHHPPGYPPHPLPHPASAHSHLPVSHHQPPQPLYHPPLYAPYSSTPYLPPTSQVKKGRGEGLVWQSGSVSNPHTVAAGSNLYSRVNRSPVGLKVVTTSCAVVTTTTTTSHRETVNSSIIGRSHSPRGHSPTRERESYSSNVSSLSRGSVGTPVSLPPYHPPPQQSSLAYNKPTSVWVSSSSSSQVGAPGGRISHPQFPAPMFPPAPPPVSSAPQPPPNPFTAESLFQSSYVCSPDQGDLLRRELDSRFLASQDRGPYIRTEMHHHQHQHTHVHQHTTPIIPPPPPTLFNPPIFKEMPKAAGMDSPFYRQSIGFTGYPGYSPGLLHSTFGPSTPFAPPTHLPTFTPKQLTEPTKPKTVKSGKWNAMHVRVAWEIYHHQQKGGLPAESKVNSLIKDPLRPPTHMFGPPFSSGHRPPPSFEPPPPPTAFPSLPQSAALGFQGGSLFGRYAPGAAPGPPGSFPALPTFPHPAPPMHDPWARLSGRGVVPPGFPTSGWAVKPEPTPEEKSRERVRREEKTRRLVQVSSKSRERSPMRAEGGTSKEEPAYLRQTLRPPHHFPPPSWEHHYRYDQLRFNPLVAAAFREDEAHKLFYPGLRAKAPSPHQPKEESSQSR